MSEIRQRDKSIFENLFVLELANNHWGKVDRGLKIIRDHGSVARQNNVRVAIKLQFRDMQKFVHPDFKGAKDIKYIQKTEQKSLTKPQFQILIDEIKNVGCIPMATPFDEASVDLCEEFDLPIIIHQRNSEKEIVEVLTKYKNDKLKIVFHCFTGSKELLQFCIENKYYISLSGIVTFKNANIIRETLKNASIDHLLIETDSPFLAPTPMRGKDNEPSFVKFTADYLADFYSMQKEDFYNLTDNNFYKLFSRAKQDS